MLEKIRQTADFIKNTIQETPEFAIVLGSGLGALKEEITPLHTLNYEDIPNFPQSTVKGHGGKLIYGELEGRKVLMMSGRFHYYEGYDMKTVTFPFRVFHLLGIKNLIVSNASGGVNPNFNVGDIMLINDHINMMPEHPLRGTNMEEFGPRFVDMSEPYHRGMLEVAQKQADTLGIKVHQGVYLGLQGPTFETPAEYGMVRALGGDAVGMSTVPEVIVAKHQGMDVFGISIITDVGGPEIAFTVSHEDVLAAADNAMPSVIKIVRGLIKNYQG
ncbi:purine-nucleoside phosphorylase [Planobacterium oryzisoli]|uniref:Purine nucleoside phosphorylase n=1 Tax=Planobacterium oryzisoli TaxID=2771435 RepID=A0A930YVQ7_9FLAO|nr:purine-nucleoside phosphorylase [Planobacterium oryzisoli]MBF5027195.1 purine-nucleoside phosphorylase [Planobacterium oryzisoli]